MNKYFLKHMQGTLLVLDLLVINLAFVAVRYFFYRQGFITAFVEYNNFMLILNIAWVGISFLCKTYHEDFVLSFELFSRASTRAFAYFMGFIMLYLYFFHQLVISRAFIVVLLSSMSVCLVFNRFLYLGIYQYFKKKDYLISRILILGYNAVAKKLVKYLEQDGFNSQIVGFCEEDENVQEVTNYPVLNTINDTLVACKTHHVTEIYSTIAPESNEFIYELIERAEQNCIRFKFIPDMGVFIKQKLFIDYIQDLPIISMRREPLEDLGNRIRKRIFDVIVSSLVIIFVLPILVIIIGLIIKIESKGPIFFRQLRTAKNNRSFYCIKFRSMFMNNNADVLQASSGDPRITPFGKFLRRSSLDEFPQFINVLMGQMSIVGPRPHMLKHTKDYARLLDKFMVRQFVKPGITGWAQVNGYRGETKALTLMQNRVDHDIWYMENWSLWLDMRIIFLTVFNLFKGEKNAG